MSIRLGSPKPRAALLAAAVLLVSWPGAARAQDGGVIRGQVTAEGGAYLEGAQVILEGTSRSAVSNRNGRYLLVGVPAGRHTLVVRYLGYGTHRAEVTVPAGGHVVHDVVLSSEAIALDPLQVELRVGQAKALQVQQNAPTIVNIVDREQMEAFPDYNTAEALQRIPGVNISRSHGEGKFVFIRGTEPRLTAVTVNGQNVATPEDEERFVALDVISANQLGGLEVTKALTPDMDADAIGGRVNLLTRSPFDLPAGTSLTQLSAAGGYNVLGGKANYQGAATYSRVFGERLGVTLNANWHRSNRLTHNNESDWGEIETVDDVVVPFGLLDTQLRRYQLQRDRYGLGADLEYRPSESSRFFLRGMFNQRDDAEDRQDSRFRVDRGDYITPTRVEDARLLRGSQERTETQYITNVALGGEHTRDAWKLDYTVAYTYGEQNKDGGQIRPEFELRGVDMDIDLSDPDHPGFTFTNQDISFIHDPANWRLSAVDYREEFTSDQERIGAINLQREFALGGSSGALKVGAKARLKSKDRDDQRWQYSWAGPGTITMADFGSNAVTEDFFDGVYTFGPTVDNAALRRWFNQNRHTPNLEEEQHIEDSVGDRYDASESIYSYYAMATLNLGRWMLLGGLRHEFTTTDYEGTRLMYDDEGEVAELTPIADERSYNHLFPAFHVRFAATDQTNIRFAFTTGIARANFFDLVPYLWVIPEDQEVIRGNSDLDPTTAVNFDLMVEHYFRSIGVLSVGLFYKDLSKIIYTRQYQETTGTFAGYDIEEPVNGGDARLYGIELNWQQQFSFLPGALSGLGIFANYTYAKSEADLLYREWTTLPGQASDAGNIALTYDSPRFDARISMNYNGKYIDEVGATPAEDEIIADHIQWDASASWAISPKAELFLNLVNLNNAPRKDYVGVESRTRQFERYGWSSSLGIKLRLD